MKRLAYDWMLPLSVFIGITVTSTLGVGAFLYLDSIEQLSFTTSLDRLSAPHLSIDIFGPRRTLNRGAFQGTDESLTAAIDHHISAVYDGLFCIVADTLSPWE